MQAYEVSAGSWGTAPWEILQTNRPLQPRGIRTCCHAILQEHAKHVANSDRADRSVREEGGAAAEIGAGGSANAAQQKLGDSGSSDSIAQSQRKHGAALLPKRNGDRGSSVDEEAAAASGGGGGSSSLSLAQRAELRADAAAKGGGGAAQGRGSAAGLDQHARQQVQHAGGLLSCFYSASTPKETP